MIRKTRKIALSLGASLALSSIVNAATEIEFWTTQTQSDRIKIIETLALTFEAMNEDIKIKVVPVDEDQMATQMAAASAAGTLPNLVEAGSELLLAFGEEGVVDKASNKKMLESIGESRFFDGALNMLQGPNGKDYYGVPFHGWVQGIWYRKDWFEAAGLDAPNTWENIEKAARVLTNKSENQYGILIGTNAESYTEQVFTQFALSNGAREFNSDGKLTFNSPEMLETLEYYQNLAEYNPPGPQTWRARDYYLQGKMAMFFYSTYIMDDLALAEVAKGSLSSENFEGLGGAAFDENLVKNTGFSPIITNTTDASYGVLVGLSAMKSKANEKKAVQKFVQYLYDPYAYITYLHMAPGGMNPMLSDIPNHPYYLKDPQGVFEVYGSDAIKDIIKGFESIQTFTVVDGKSYPQSGQIFAKKIIPKMVYSVIFEGVAPADALADAEAEMKDLISQ
jgi:multiple sugar transport system substrate-binding protein